MAQEPPSRVYDVAVLGAGASGTLIAVHLLRQARSGVRIALVVEARWRPRGGGDARAERFARIVNCTCSALAYDARSTPVVASLIAAGLARPGPLGIGLDTEGAGALRDASGKPSDRLFAIGPPRRGELWESHSVADVRTQAAALAALLAG
jgi:uncharacterized NAD(P)/FAD-binding protein YdhS